MAKDKEPRQLASQYAGVNSLVDLDRMIDNIAQKQDFDFTTMDRDTLIQNAVSTGVLSLDLLMGGGYAPGRFSYWYGATGTCKSTILFQSLRETLQSNIQAMIFDHEGSIAPDYLEKLGVMLDEVCGYRNKKGDWEKTRQLYYASPQTAEDTFQFMYQMLNALPRKIKLADDSGENHYFLIHPEYGINVSWSSIMKGMKEKVKDRPAVVEVEDFCPQFVFMIDSLRAMISNAQDMQQDNKDKEKKDIIADLARVLSKSFRLIKGMLHTKHCIMIATNHITVNPMAGFGNPEVEPGGNAVQFYPDFKGRLHINRAESKILEEAHISGDGVDRYLLGTAKVMKNKAGPSFRRMDYRLWLDERGDPGRGIDPVWDMYTFLESTGMLVQGARSSEDEAKTPKNKFTVKVPGVVETNFDWQEFKKFVMVDYNDGSHHLRETCKKLLAEGEAQRLYYDFLKNNPTAKKKKASFTGAKHAEDSTEEFEEMSATV